MNHITHFKKAFLLLALCCNGRAQAQRSDELYQTLSRLDSVFFTAYNTCDMKTQAAFYNDSIEFFHDRSGLETSKERLLANTRRYICGKVTRELVKGSLVVSPLPGYGAVVLGMHQFRNSEEKGQVPKPSQFVMVWKKENERWTITKVISLH